MPLEIVRYEAAFQVPDLDDAFCATCGEECAGGVCDGDVNGGGVCFCGAEERGLDAGGGGGSGGGVAEGVGSHCLRAGADG